MSLQNHRAVIIGGTSGIGLAVAKSLLTQGAQIIVASRSQIKVDEAKKELGQEAQGLVLDFRDESQTKQFFESLGPFEHLVVTAAGDSAMTPFNALPIDTARAAFDSKFWGQYLTVKAALPFIKKSGSITLTSGTFSIRPAQGTSTVAAINSAIEGLVRGLAVDLAPIRINAVSPGVVDTPIFSGMDEESREAMFQAIAQSMLLKHIAKPEEIAEAYVYLAKNTFTTGSVIHVEGGAILS
ncbi:SDR family oxidoreductase [Paenibacillus rigui]|uniref:Short chain dehydrogenase n=1 Tax=Paenibacillus rigui TaxID=554312 RepID=A0A229UPL4_9BACL|nr:SDR family oxidoreductase [Paenibacillus rigui]OXM85300.1 short chain dehydrogenase [Paenibacillus rigui]